MYHGNGYGHASWLIIVIPLALIVLRAVSSGRRRGTNRPPAPPSFFVDQPSRPGPAPSAPPPAEPATNAANGTPAGWFTDPFFKHEQRYWSGTAWTEHCLDNGVPGNDPPPPPPEDEAPRSP